MYNAKASVNNVHNSTEPGIDVLKGFVPMAELSDSHLRSAARISRVVTVPEAQTVADRKMLQTQYVYLLSGEVLARAHDQCKEETHDATDSSMLSLSDLFPKSPLISATTDCQVLYIDREEMDCMLCWDQVAKSLMTEINAERDYDEDREWLQTLLMSNLFHKIPPYNIHRVVDRFEARVVQSGEAIIREGDRGDECYLIKEGQAVVTVFDENKQEPNVVAELTSGQCFGEDALVNMTVRNATVTMSTNGVLMALKKREFLALMSEPDIPAIPLLQAKIAVDKGAQWLDVRTQQEFDHHHESDAFHLPLHLMVLKSRLMQKEQSYYAYCATGRRAATAAYLLQREGFNVTPVIPHSDLVLRAL